MIVAIDGPAGAGKSSVARQLAERVNFQHLDSGAFYRCFAYIALESSKDICSADGWDQLINSHQVRADYNSDPAKFFVNDEDVSELIRENRVSNAVASVSTHSVVRNAVVRTLRDVSTLGNFIVDGRDIGSVVFPNAELKFFLTASIQERAKRRHLELKMKGTQVELNQLENEIRLRDESDSTRVLSPLMQAEDAELIDSTHMEIIQVIELIKSKIESRMCLIEEDLEAISSKHT